jgi:hypothetical protein
MGYDSKLAFLERILGKAKYHHNTNEAEFYSPFCDHHKKKLSINLETDRWQCWISGKNGKKLLYVLKEAGASGKDLQEYIESHKAKGVVASTRTTDIPNVSLPKEYQALVNCKDSILGRKAYGYLQRRGITDDDILRYKIGIAVSGEYEGRIIFPSFSKEGRVNFFTARSDSGHYLNVQDLPKGYKNNIVLNELNIDWKKPVVLTEGFVDMLKAVRNTIPLFGSTLHEDTLLFEKLVAASSSVVLAMDTDAWKKEENIAKKLSKFDLTVYTVELGPYSDVGEMTKEQFAEAYENATLWTPEGSFRKKLKMLC